MIVSNEQFQMETFSIKCYLRSSPTTGLSEKLLHTHPNAYDRRLCFVIVYGHAFALTANISKPIPGCHEKGTVEALGMGENVFGLLIASFLVLRRPIYSSPDKAINAIWPDCTCVATCAGSP
jgi:hypothetical protein